MTQETQFTLSQEVLDWVEKLPYNDKVKARLKRQMVVEKVDYTPDDLLEAIYWVRSPEGFFYWDAIDDNKPNPDQYLPKGYIDVDNEGGKP